MAFLSHSRCFEPSWVTVVSCCWHWIVGSNALDHNHCRMKALSSYTLSVSTTIRPIFNHIEFECHTVSVTAKLLVFILCCFMVQIWIKVTCRFWGVHIVDLMTSGKMAVSRSKFDKTQFEQLPNDPVLTAILNNDEVDLDQGNYCCYC